MSEAKRVEWTRRAVLDLDRIFEYHRERSPMAARRRMRRIAERAASLADAPESGAYAPDLEPEGFC